MLTSSSSWPAVSSVDAWSVVVVLALMFAGSVVIWTRLTPKQLAPLGAGRILSSECCRGWSFPSGVAVPGLLPSYKFASTSIYHSHCFSIMATTGARFDAILHVCVCVCSLLQCLTFCLSSWLKCASRCTLLNITMHLCAALYLANAKTQNTT